LFGASPEETVTPHQTKPLGSPWWTRRRTQTGVTRDFINEIVHSCSHYILGFNGIFMGIQYNTMGISGINTDPALPTWVFDKINMIGT